MADFKKAYLKMKHAEYSGKEYLFLHYLGDEKGFTCGGIYQKANPFALDWDYIENLYKLNDNMKRTAVMLYHDRETQKKVFNHLKDNYWDISNLSDLQDQKMAEEIYMASVLYSPIKAVKMAQKLAQVKPDGDLGRRSLKGLNNLNALYFDVEYDKLEEALAESIAEKHDKHHYLNGWKLRANDSWNIEV